MIDLSGGWPPQGLSFGEQILHEESGGGVRFMVGWGWWIA